MNPRRTNQVLLALAVTLVLAGVAAVLLAAMLPTEADVPTLSRGAGATQGVATSQPVSLPPLAAFERLWTLPLRQKLTDLPPPPAETATPAPTTAMPPVLLVGTIGTSLALFKSGDAVVIRAVGESLEGVEIVAIYPSRVEVRYNGRLATLEKPTEPAPR